MTECDRPTLDGIAALLEAAAMPASPATEPLVAELRRQRRRLVDVIFHLAVVGQFKRGKSTLLNAMMGRPLLSTGVLPLTAVPTFLMGGERFGVRLHALNGQVEEPTCGDFPSLVREVAVATTEEMNSNSGKHLDRVEVTLPNAPWLEEVVLIDTPGIGSTQIHNTRAAHAVLPECDAAIFVTSIDPPITEVEIDYLSQVCAMVSRVIVVLNKVDLVDAVDRSHAIGFLERILASRPEKALDRHVFAISARTALVARCAGDEPTLLTSGLRVLEDYVRSTLVEEKRSLLEWSIFTKVRHVADELLAAAEMAEKVLALPLAELETKRASFELSVLDFGRERSTLIDGLEGEWRRSIAKLEALCRDLDQRVSARMEPVIDLAGGDLLDADVRARISSEMNDAFDAEYSALVLRFEDDLAGAIGVHRDRHRALVERVRAASGALVGVELPAVVPEDWFLTRRQSCWVAEHGVDSLGALTLDGLFRLLPRRWCRFREKRRLREAVVRAITRNVSDLHYSMRQDMDDSFRRLMSSSRDAVDAGVAFTLDLLTTARRQCSDENDASRSLRDRAHAEVHRLQELRAMLDGWRDRHRAGRPSSVATRPAP